MPELPEVESTRLALIPALEGRRIVAVDVRRERMLRRQPNPEDFETRLVGRTIRRLERHGKFLMARLSRDLTWVTHLGMSGRVQLAVAGDPEAPHTNVVVRVGERVEFRLVDPRTFGFVAAFTPAELSESSVGALGPDAWSNLPSTSELQGALHGRTAPLKPVLLDQRVVSGIGNIYADEALNLAAISPHRRAGSLSNREASRLRDAITATLRAGLASGGTSLDDLAYLLPDGRAGDYTAELRAYGRGGEPCRRCGNLINREYLGQRSTYWCPRCQI